METLSKLEPDLIKASICQGDKDGIRVLTDLYFGEIWASILTGEESEQINALINLEIDLRNNTEEFCNSKERVEVYLKKKWREKLADLRKRTIMFNPDFMGDWQEQTSGEEAETQHTPLAFQYRYFLLSLNPILRMLFEVKYLQGLNGKNGLFQVTHFLLNMTSIANPMQTKVLNNNELYEPLIPSFLLEQAKHAFTNQVSKKQETLQSLLKNLPIKRESLKKAFHKFEMKMFRTHNHFKEKLDLIKPLTLAEQTLILINDYLKIENYIELWVRMNIDSQYHADFKKELIQLGLFDERITDKYIDWKKNAIIKNLNPKKNDLILMTDKIKQIQEGINNRFQKTIKWSTR